jgi:hypothetical protein
LRLIVIYIETRDRALNRKKEYISIKLFKGENYNRKITSRGILIIIYDPKANISSSLYWEHNDNFKDRETIVPTSYIVRVIGVTV